MQGAERGSHHQASARAPAMTYPVYRNVATSRDMFLSLNSTPTLGHRDIFISAIAPDIVPVVAMALIRPIPPLLQILVPALNGPIQPILNLPFFHRLSQPFRLIPTPFAAFALPLPLIPSIPSVSDIWEGILKAVPKKKTSHRKKRQRFMAGKGLKDLTSLNRCAACGRVKRAHILCTYCVAGMHHSIMWVRAID